MIGIRCKSKCEKNVFNLFAKELKRISSINSNPNFRDSIKEWGREVEKFVVSSAVKTS